VITTTPDSARFLFWNLYTSGRERLDGDDTRWQQQMTILQENPAAVIGLTECWRWDADDHQLFREAQDTLGIRGELYLSKTGCHQAILWHPDVEVIETRAQPHELAEWHGYGTALLRLPGWSTAVRVVVTHLFPFGVLKKYTEVDLLRPFADPRTGVPVVMMMDGNTVPPDDDEPDWSVLPDHQWANHMLPGERTADRTPLQTLTTSPKGDALLVDVGAHQGNRDATAGYYDPDDPERRIDLAYVTPPLTDRLHSYTVIRDHRFLPQRNEAGIVTGPGASDHAALAFQVRNR
jgi:hypothetical protein